MGGRGRIEICGIAAAGAVAAVLALLPCASAHAAPKPGTKVERPVRSLAPDRRRVKEYFVRVYSPLPASFGPHPAACDWITYLRFRSADGPRNPSQANAVFVIIPGFLGGASNFDQVARNTIRDAAKRGKSVEFWAIDRRSNCLEDNRGVAAAAKARDPELGYGYYWGGQAVRGRTFAGWVSPQDAAWEDDLGLAQTLRDWYTVIRIGIPNRRVRRHKVICGGHSMGGPMTAAFASWDFDGDPKARGDAGYNQCAAFVGLDTVLRVRGLPLGADPSSVLGQLEANSGPYVNVPPLVPETEQLPPIFGIGSYFNPQGTDLLANLPHSANIDLAQRFLFSHDAAHFATGMPSIRDFTVTNQVSLAGVFDDNSSPLFFTRSSLGFLAGGPLWDKDFPQPNPTLALPKDPSTPLYSWRSYRQVGKHGAPIPLNEEGQPYTDRRSEATSIRQFSRIQFDAPANFIEQYFPTKLLRDLQAAGDGDRSGDLAHLMYPNGPDRRPALIVRAGDSQDNTNPDGGPPKQGPAPNSRPLSRSITIPGYNHLDVLTAARRQNNGRLEPSSLALAKFALAVTSAGRRRASR